MKIYKQLFISIVLLSLNACVSTPVNQLDDQYQLGLAYLNAHRWQLACDNLANIAEKHATPSLFYSLAYCEEQLGHNILAQNDYAKAIRSNPNDAHALNNYGAFLCRIGHYQQGVTYLIRAASTPAYLYRANSYANAAICSWKEKNYRNAKVYLRQAIAIKPDLIESNRALKKMVRVK